MATARLVLVNVPEPQEIVAEACALVKPGGWVAFHEADWIAHVCDPASDAWSALVDLFMKATHAVEIPYVFNNLRPPRLFPDASSPELASASGSERARAERVSSHWVNFARTGDPNGRGLPRWPTFSDARSAPMIIGDVNETPAPQRLALYDKLYAKILASLKE